MQQDNKASKSSIVPLGHERRAMPCALGLTLGNAIRQKRRAHRRASRALDAYRFRTAQHGSLTASAFLSGHAGKNPAKFRVLAARPSRTHMTSEAARHPVSRKCPAPSPSAGLMALAPIGLSKGQPDMGSTEEHPCRMEQRARLGQVHAAYHRQLASHSPQSAEIHARGLSLRRLMHLRRSVPAGSCPNWITARALRGLASSCSHQRPPRRTALASQSRVCTATRPNRAVCSEAVHMSGFDCKEQSLNSGDEPGGSYVGERGRPTAMPSAAHTRSAEAYYAESGIIRGRNLVQRTARNGPPSLPAQCWRNIGPMLALPRQTRPRCSGWQPARPARIAIRPPHHPLQQSQPVPAVPQNPGNHINMGAPPLHLWASLFFSPPPPSHTTQRAAKVHIGLSPAVRSSHPLKIFLPGPSDNR